MENLKTAIMKKEERVAIASESLAHFTYIYLNHYAKYDAPEFHKQIYKDLQRDDISFLELLAFRGSAKSTIASLALPLWSAVTGRKKFIIPISDSFPQAKLHIANIIYELENNEQLIEDFGPFKTKEEWTATNIILQIGARILSRSRGQKIRGLRHLQYRPDLIIGDDLENNEVVRTKDQRDKTAEWWNAEVIPALDTDNGMLVLIGSLLHNDSLMARQKKLIEEKGIGVLKEYPIMRDNGEILWPQRFTKKNIANLKIKVGSMFFLREYLLKLVPEEGQVIKKVRYYTELPKVVKIAIAADLAISQKQTAHLSAINVLAKVEDGNFYNLGNFAGRWGGGGTLKKINEVYTNFRNAYPSINVLLGIENIAYQQLAVEEFTRRYGIKPIEIKTTTDKRARLEASSPYFESGQIYFREEGDEDVVSEILNFGVEEFDDRMDSFLMSLNLLVSAIRPDIRTL